MGIFSKKINREGGIAGMISGITFTLGYIIYFQFVAAPGTAYPFGISPEGIGFVGMIINFIVAFVVSSFTPPIPDDVKDMIESIRIPKGAGEATH